MSCLRRSTQTVFPLPLSASFFLQRLIFPWIISGFFHHCTLARLLTPISLVHTKCYVHPNCLFSLRSFSVVTKRKKKKNIPFLSQPSPHEQKKAGANLSRLFYSVHTCSICAGNGTIWSPCPHCCTIIPELAQAPEPTPTQVSTPTVAANNSTSAGASGSSSSNSAVSGGGGNGAATKQSSE